MTGALGQGNDLASKKQKAKAKRIFRVSVVMLDQMLSYCEWAREDGSYFGNEAQFRQRHARIVKWLKAIRERRWEAQCK